MLYLLDVFGLSEIDVEELMKEYRKAREFAVMPPWVDALMKENPQILRHYYGLLRAVMLNEKSFLPPKVKELIVLAIGVAMNDSHVVVSHVKHARRVGATKEEILETIFLALPIVGYQAIQAMLKALEKLREMEQE